MKYEDVQDVISRCESWGTTRATLVVRRKTPPRSDYITVKNIGKAYVMNTQQRSDKYYDIVASFEVSDLKKWASKCEQMLRQGFRYKENAPSETQGDAE